MMQPVERVIAEEIGAIIRRDLDVTGAWDDGRVVREAEQRLCRHANAGDVRSALAGMPDYWRAVVQQARRTHGKMRE